MSNPSWERMAMSAFFAVCVYLPCISFERVKKHGNDEEKNGS
jgi:hypothetical protein